MQFGTNVLMATAAAILISTKLVEPKHFAGKGQDARSWLSTLKCYYIVGSIKYVTTDSNQPFKPVNMPLH